MVDEAVDDRYAFFRGLCSSTNDLFLGGGIDLIGGGGGGGLVRVRVRVRVRVQVRVKFRVHVFGFGFGPDAKEYAQESRLDGARTKGRGPKAEC